MHSTLSQQQQKEQQQQGKVEEEQEFVDEDHSNNTLLEEQDAKESMSETEIQKNQYLDHFSRLKKLIFKFEQIVEDEKNNGIGEVITETPMQDKEALMKSVVDELKKMVYSLEKMVFIEAAHLLTAESEDDVVIESIDNREDEWNKDLFENDDEAEEEEGEDDESSAVSSSSKNNSKNKKRYSQADVFMDEQVEDDTQEAFDESFTPIDSALYNQLIQVLQYIGSSMERGEVACSLLTKIYELMTRLANEYANAPAELFKQPFFKDNAMIRLNTDMFNQLLKSYALHGSNQNVVIVLQDMKEREIKANAHTYHGLIQLAMYHGDYVRATKILEYARQCGFEPLPETLALFNEEQEDF